ncbi:UDP-N-acetylglucosamine--N-acetylmuramyl-(pentapeptide) pyrophosphoryl-undecaprenol N-acetylglucosamine transferase MurG [Candidatus Kinetoplastibacterium desouzaii TCC079E]|uniref:UDP-N-acetylglucosamine--N-acetylmuramyl-(pentapeptide) pyrophosphoryl-undecaprenol N-acetylglucosamine transferase n=1 Tax=Candidatus Kinetoplastidibacterium desouzai TCC079E TaxID=1208919 RepID=M1LSM6_9PROT|nr:undecaprenyldiphospho-muramoylpentapeptide beta-N-acetylglucosaminyltransferase [Candidatus Kinetoplastibacterium desouzaii]AGF47121.1 UDP-N-acetylglucosamine--N-acetylmuramyl-(pentapeptide) pyrophosphoryl-undecaprenol N-acetylglucosamine transferase MurG [Candidatus Kinetoplastibacterium desouzaii TCC079E]
MDKNLAIIIAGGTAGHIMPGLVVADILRKRGWEILWLGNHNRMEGHIVPAHGLEFSSINFNGIPNKKIITLLTFPFRLIRSMILSWKIISTKKPIVVIGMGGHVTIPACLVAFIKRIPIVIHEQNAIVGRANNFLYRFAYQMLSGYPITKPLNVSFIGNPVRERFFEVPGPSLRYSVRDNKKLNLLILGGSLGSGDLNCLLPAALSLMPDESRPIVTHQCGRNNLERLEKLYKNFDVRANCLEFIEDMVTVLSEADLVICRSGAITISEITAIGVASLLIPFPKSIKNHQLKNAEILSNSNAAWLKRQEDLTPELLARWLLDLDRSKLRDMAIRAYSFSRRDSGNKIADICDSLRSL